MDRREFCQLFIPGFGPAVDAIGTKSLNPLDWSPHTRAGLVIQGSALGLIACNGGVKPTADQQIMPTPPAELLLAPEQLGHPECIKLGQELKQWQLTNGEYMTDLFPVVKQTAELLQGKQDPRKFIPFLQLPIGFAIDRECSADIAYLDWHIIYPSTSSTSLRSIRTSLSSSEQLTIPFPLSMDFSLHLTPEVRENTVRWPVVVKEISQILDYPLYSQRYVNLLKKEGVIFELNNPENILTTNQEINTAISYYLMIVELNQKGKSWFKDLVDKGSFIRTAPVFANWYLDQHRICNWDANNCPQLKNKAVEIGKKWSGYLQSEGFIYQEGDKFFWTDGAPPPIDSVKFMALLNKAISSD